MNEQQNQVVQQVHSIVRQRMEGQGAGHDFDHVLRVLSSARQICRQLPADDFVVDLAALLHDVGDAKFHDGVERSAEFSRQILNDLNQPSLLTENVIDHIAHIVDNISFRKGVDPDELSIEGKIVQDADRLDALGAVGIVRTIEYGAVKGQPFYIAGEHDQKTGIGHFDDKLFKLRGLLNTEPARQLAGEREEFMRTFLDQFLKECGS